MKLIWKIFLAYMHWSDSAVCEMSCRGDGKDYHDYHDDESESPLHMFPLTCKRCGKDFTI